MYVYCIVWVGQGYKGEKDIKDFSKTVTLQTVPLGQHLSESYGLLIKSKDSCALSKIH